MKTLLTCQEATRLVLQSEDRALRTSERLRLRLHMVICKACPRFVQQVQLMRQAMGRWQAYGESTADDATTADPRAPR